MRIGIHAAYQKCDATLMALRVARHLRGAGYSVDYLPRGQSSEVHPEWDGQVLSDKKRKRPYHQWITSRFSYIFWTEVPPPDQLHAARACDSKNILLVSWDELNEDLLPVYRLFDRLVCPSWLASTLLADRLKLRNVSYCPWDVGVPLSANPHLPNPSAVRLFWSLWGSQAERQNGAAVYVLDKLLSEHNHVRLTVSFSTAALRKQIIRALEAMSRRHSPRLSLLKDKNYDRHILETARHDLLVWPSLVESVGIAGLSALCMGVPVLAFDVPPISEFLKDGKNGLLVPCELRYNSLGVPFVDPQDYKVFGEHLTKAVQNPNALAGLRKSVFTGLSERQEMFSRAWESVLGS